MEGGTYSRGTDVNGKPHYTDADSFEIQWSGSRWELLDDFDGMLYYHTSTADTVPLSGWVDDSGSGYVLEISE